MATPFGPTSVPRISDNRHTNKGTVIFSYTCVGLTVAAVLSVLVFFCHHIRNRAPVTAAEAETAGPGDRPHSVDVTKLPEFAYTRSARHSGKGGAGDGPQCSVCLGAVQVGEMVRLLPVCKHLYHAECIDMWLALHATCPMCRSEVDLPGPREGQPAPTTVMPQELPV